MARVEPIHWRGPLKELCSHVSRRFARRETRARLPAVLLALPGDLSRKNAWTLAEQIGDATPDGVQHLLSRASWDTDGVAADLRTFITAHLGDPRGSWWSMRPGT